MLNNYAAAYEYCNAYAFLTQFSAVVELDFSFMSERMTTWSLILSNELSPYWLDMMTLFDEPILDWYLVGMRNGLMFKLLFDIKIPAA
jgi:hypothetical protein